MITNAPEDLTPPFLTSPIVHLRASLFIIAGLSWGGRFAILFEIGIA